MQTKNRNAISWTASGLFLIRVIRGSKKTKRPAASYSSIRQALNAYSLGSKTGQARRRTSSHDNFIEAPVPIRTVAMATLRNDLIILLTF
jgi:hypothetical protein